jgi:hypothetical protein
MLAETVPVFGTLGLRELIRDNRAQWGRGCGIKVYDQGPKQIAHTDSHESAPILAAIHLSVISLTHR